MIGFKNEDPVLPRVAKILVNLGNRQNQEKYSFFKYNNAGKSLVLAPALVFISHRQQQYSKEQKTLFL